MATRRTDSNRNLVQMSSKAITV